MGAGKARIEQEVARDLSNPHIQIHDAFERNMFSGNRLQHDPLGTKDSFDATTAKCSRFLQALVRPNNAILLVVATSTQRQFWQRFKEYYGSIPRKRISARPEIKSARKTESFTSIAIFPICWRSSPTACRDRRLISRRANPERRYLQANAEFCTPWVRRKGD